MRFTLRCVQCMVTTVLRDQQYTFGVRSLLAAEKALLIRNDMAGVLLRRPMPQLLQSDRRVSISDIVRHTGISRVSVHRIARNHLKFQKVSAQSVPKQLKLEQQAMRMMTSLDNLQRYKTEREAMLERIVTGYDTWVHHYQPETKQASRQWKHKESPTPTKFKVVPSVSKLVATVFWDMRGVLLVEFQEHGRTVNASSYCNLLERLRTAIRTKRKGLLTQGVILLHDNTRPHTARLTQETVEHLGLEVLPHPPYGPDLAPSDYHLFGPMKKMLGGGGRNSHQIPRCNQSFSSGLDSSQHHSLHRVFRSLFVCCLSLVSYDSKLM